MNEDKLTTPLPNKDWDLILNVDYERKVKFLGAIATIIHHSFDRKKNEEDLNVELSSTYLSVIKIVLNEKQWLKEQETPKAQDPKTK